MKEIKLTKGKIARVDDYLFEDLNKHRWYCDSEGYAARNIRLPNGKQSRVKMHRVICSVVDLHTDVDHIDHDRLNNQMMNLRVCNRRENARNKGKYKGISKFKGVSIMTRRLKGHEYRYFRSRIMVDGKTLEKLFPFTVDGEKEAAMHYNELAKKHFGDFASLNNI